MILIRAAGYIAIAAAVALVLGVLALTIVAITSPPRPQAQFQAEPLPPGVRFIDRFRTLDQARWAAADRGPNGPHMENDFRPSQARITREGLEIVMETAPNGAGSPLSSAEIVSRDPYSYGYYEFRMRVPRGRGVISGAFTFVLPDESSSAQELDIEILGTDTRTLALTYHVNGRSVQKLVPLGFDAAEGFHNYAVEWAPSEIRWYVDGDMVHEVRSRIIAGITRPQYIVIDLWGTQRLYRWAERIDPAQGPWRLAVACVAQAESYPGRMLC